MAAFVLPQQSWVVSSCDRLNVAHEPKAFTVPIQKVGHPLSSRPGFLSLSTIDILVHVMTREGLSSALRGVEQLPGLCPQRCQEQHHLPPSPTQLWQPNISQTLPDVLWGAKSPLAVRPMNLKWCGLTKCPFIILFILQRKKSIKRAEEIGFSAPVH